MMNATKNLAAEDQNSHSFQLGQAQANHRALVERVRFTLDMLAKSKSKSDRDHYLARLQKIADRHLEIVSTY